MIINVEFGVNRYVTFLGAIILEVGAYQPPSDAPGAKNYGRIRGLDISVDRGGPKESKNAIKIFKHFFGFLTIFANNCLW